MFVGKDNGVRLDVLADGPGEEHGLHFFVSRFALADKIEVGGSQSVNVPILDKKAARDLLIFDFRFWIVDFGLV